MSQCIQRRVVTLLHHVDPRLHHSVTLLHRGVTTVRKAPRWSVTLRRHKSVKLKNLITPKTVISREI